MDDSEPSDEATTCKMVDYVFFVLQKVCRVCFSCSV